MEKRQSGPTKTLVRCVKKSTPSVGFDNGNSRTISLLPTSRSSRMTETCGTSTQSDTRTLTTTALYGPNKCLYLGTPTINSSAIQQHQMGTLQASLARNPACESEERLIPLNERITKQVNFPQDRAVFKNLIPLDTTDGKEYTPSSRIELVYATDREPVPGKYTKHSVKKEYSICIPRSAACDKIMKEYRGNKFYVWNEALHDEQED